jgi:putative CocE/NonD family hydrolase
MVQITRDLMITLADGTQLSADLYRPDDAPPGPVLVSYYPYRKDDVIGSLFEQTRIRLCERGYASVFADMAGTGASGGDYAESFDLPREGRDLAEVIEWVAGQDWCDGNVGAWGVSYGGMNALAAAACRPPHLRAIVAVYATTDPYQDTIAPGGCPVMLGRYAWAAHMAALGLCPPTQQDPDGRWRHTWRQRLRRLAQERPHALNWQAHPERDDYWQARVVDATAIEVPAMLVGGWADGYKDAMTSLFQVVRGPKRLVMGPWMHVLPHLSEVEPYDWVSEMADWWDAYLRQPATVGETAPVVFFARGEGWRSARQWPPDGIRQMELFPAGHRLDAEPPPDPGSRDYQGDAAVGLAAGIWDPLGTGNGWAEEQSCDDARSLTFTSEPLAEPLLIAGRPEAELQLTHLSAGEAQIVVRLSMVGPDGQSTLITNGFHRSAGEGLAVITLGATAFTLPAGARLRLSVACADFPRIWPSPANPVIRVGFGPGRSSVLRVPVGEAGLRCDAPAEIPRPPAGRDTGWVIDGEPLYGVCHDKSAGQVAVTFGAKTRLRAPSGADLKLDERFTARLRSDHPDGAALIAKVDISLRLPAGERVEVVLRSTSSRTETVIEGRVAMDGTELLHRSWPGN